MFWSTKGSIVVGIDYDCRERMVYWTDVAGRAISRASLVPGAEPETIINSGQQLHPEDALYFMDSTKFNRGSALQGTSSGASTLAPL